MGSSANIKIAYYNKRNFRNNTTRYNIFIRYKSLFISIYFCSFTCQVNHFILIVEIRVFIKCFSWHFSCADMEAGGVIPPEAVRVGNAHIGNLAASIGNGTLLHVSADSSGL